MLAEIYTHLHIFARGASIMLPQRSLGDSYTESLLQDDLFLDSLFEAQAKRTPMACAVRHGDTQISYEQLSKDSNRIARYLRCLGIGPDIAVAIRLRPSIALVSTMLGVLKAGACYLPISPSVPKIRLRAILEDSDAPLLITSGKTLRSDTSVPCRVISLDASAAAIARHRAEPAASLISGENLAYIIYTSGSTGRPKGVMVSHSAICNTLRWRQATFPFRVGDRVLLTLSFAFDASIFQIIQPLLVGACVVIPETTYNSDATRMVRVVRQEAITVLAGTPSMWRLWLQEPDIRLCESIRLAFSGGEALPEDIPENVREYLGIELHNMYGPTEAAMEATFWTCKTGGPILIGRPIANMSAYILDEGLHPTPSGVAGELYLSGAGLARGYLNDPALTAECFRPDPFDKSGGARMYRTGDICRWSTTGCLEYVGRLDHQVKLNGHRIELQEIEAVLQRAPEVREAAVLLRNEGRAGRHLVAYVVREGTQQVGAEELQEYLRARLPTHMLPTRYLFLSSLPRTQNGKLDIRGLPSLDRRKRTNWQPGHDLKSILATLWREVLCLDSLGYDDDFFELGGNSIHVAILMGRLEKTLNEFVYTVALYDAPTINKLAQYLRHNYPCSVARLTGQRVRTDVDLARGEGAVNEAKIDVLKNLIRALPERPVGGQHGPKNRGALFVLSAPRSGSTLLRVMLGRHPALFAPPEMQLLNFNTLGERRAALSSERDQFWLQGTIRALMEIWNCDAEMATRIMNAYERRNMTVKQFYRILQRRLGERMLVDKTPMYSLDPQSLKRAEEDFLESRYIHLVRRPASMIVSFLEAKLQVFFPPFLTGRHDLSSRDFAEAIWSLSNQNIGEFLQSIPPERQILVQFEELVETPRCTMERISDWLGLEFFPGMVKPYSEGREKSMTDSVHPLGRMLGDVKFHKHGRIDPSRASRRRDAQLEGSLGPVAKSLAASYGYPASRRPQQVAIEALQSQGSRPPLFCIHAAGGIISCYSELARDLGSDQPFYAFRPLVLSAPNMPCESLPALASLYLRELQEFWPSGPYQLCGWSFGGLVAFEMALQLAASRQNVTLVALFDSYLARGDVPYPPVQFRSAPQLCDEYVPGGAVVSARRRPGLESLRHRGRGRRSEDAEFRRASIKYRRAYRAHMRIARGYVPSRRVERIVLFEAEDRSEAVYGWAEDWNAAADEVCHHTVPGNHFTILRRPNVHHVAAALKDHLYRGDVVDADGEVLD